MIVDAISGATSERITEQAGERGAQLPPEVAAVVGDPVRADITEALPPFYQAYADWLPIRYVIDGLRSLLFYNGTLGAASLEGGWRDSLWFLGGDGRSEAAGLEDAVWMIIAYLGCAAALGYVISLLRDLATRRGRRETSNPPEGAEATG